MTSQLKLYAMKTTPLPTTKLQNDHTKELVSACLNQINYKKPPDIFTLHPVSLLTFN